MKRMFLALVALLSFTFIAAAADVTGKWTADLPGRNGTQTNTFTFKMDGAKLTGSVENQRGATDISEGKVEGDTVSFVVVRNFNGNEMKQTYKGMMKGDDTIDFTADNGRGPQTFTAKKAK